MFWSTLLPLYFGWVTAGLTPEELLSAPRVGDFVPNTDGSLAIFTSSEYSFDSHISMTTWNLLNLAEDTTIPLPNLSGAETVTWLGIDSETLLYTKLVDGGVTELWIASHSDVNGGYKAGSIPGPVSNLKSVTAGTSVHIVFSGQAYPNGSIYNPSKAPPTYTSGLVYESLYVRHWDEYIRRQTSTLFAGSFMLQDGLYTLDPSQLTNLLRSNTGLETPVPPFGGASDFDISSDGTVVVFVSKAPDLNPANNTASYCYVVPFSGSRPPVAINSPNGLDIFGNSLAKGASSSPVISPDGKSVAYLQMYKNGYEADQNKIFIAQQSGIRSILPTWDVSPSRIVWTADGDGLYILAEWYGRERLYKTSLGTSHVDELYGKHSISGLSLLPKGNVLLSINSLISSATPYVFNQTSRTLTQLSSASYKFNLDSSQVEDFSFSGVDTEVHGFLVKPSNFVNRDRAWPMAFFIHGGPQGAWTDSWSTRWNPVVFAEQGYVVIAVNPTGSTGYGQKFTDAIQGEWGGKPYLDLELALEHITTNPRYGYIDTDKMVALGASYGGYMINYIQGMPLGKKFKALVCHDGVFSTLNQYSSEELYFPTHDFQGAIWENRGAYEKWDPARLVHNWATPQMVIHNELDYRLPISEGIAVFNVLQEKGIPSKFLTFIDENHWVLKPENSLMWHKEVFEWIKRFTVDTDTAQTAKESKSGWVSALSDAMIGEL